MSVFLDSSILIASVVPSEHRHAESMALVMTGTAYVYQHAFLETFAMLTGGRLGSKADADLVARMIKLTLLPRVRVVHLSESEVVDALQTARRHGVRGGGVYDFMHFDFQQLARAGDPMIQRP
ncbi:MAG: PIN domain-containing protein [Prosthecobacter sp.]